jgi:hypothetical protein
VPVSTAGSGDGRPQSTYFALLALLAVQALVVALPGGPFFGRVSPVGLLCYVVVLAMLARGSRWAWWLATVTSGLAAAGALAFSFTGPEGGAMAEIERLDTGIWLVGIVAIFVLLVSPSMRSHVRRSAARPA